MVESLFGFKNFKIRKKVMESLFSINNLKSRKKVIRRSPFFIIKNFKSRKAVMEFFLNLKSFKRGKKEMESFFSGHSSLSFHIIHDFLGQYFLCQFPLNFFDDNNILIFMKKDAEYISVNTVGATFLLHK